MYRGDVAALSALPLTRPLYNTFIIIHPVVQSAVKTLYRQVRIRPDHGEMEGGMNVNDEVHVSLKWERDGTRKHYGMN